MFKMNASTVSVTDFKLVNPKLAKVIVSYTGRQDSKSLRAAIAEKFEGLAAVVEHSFKLVKPGVAVGFLRANREVRAVDDKELNASYRLMSSNIVMSNEDKTLWGVKEGKGGKYLQRQGQEDLSALVASKTHHRSDVPGLRHLAIAKAATSELIAFVTEEGSMDYGFAVANIGSKVRLVSNSARVQRTVDYDNVVSIIPVQMDKEVKAQVQASLSKTEKADAVAYWTKLYSFAPEYMREVIRQVEEDTVS